MSLEFITESHQWRTTLSLVDRVKKCQLRARDNDGELTNLFSDIRNYLEWQRYVAGRRNHRWDENLRPINRDRNGYTDHEMMRDFKKLKAEHERSPRLSSMLMPTSIVDDAIAALDESQIRQFEVDELEIQLQTKLRDLEAAHDLFRDKMCEIRRQTTRVRPTVRSRPVTFPSRENREDALKGGQSLIKPDQTSADLPVRAQCAQPGNAQVNTRMNTASAVPPMIPDFHGESFRLANHRSSLPRPKNVVKRGWSSIKKVCSRRHN
ncbi:uncharacterized protein [Diadema antillarum]|uniref:uncharacterized protein n=1 Tax=Diadema antillarum TaxID=105358 RepID=UPI003A863D6A